jgi:predicted Rossmann fold flavoprotein
MPYDAIIIGAGASGLMTAATAAEKGRRLLIIDHARTIAQKILASGGGRCNFTNMDIGPGNYRCGNPDFVRSAISRFSSRDALEFFSKNGIAWEERDNGKVFGRHSSRLIVEAFRRMLKKAGVKILTRCEISSVEKRENFIVRTNLGEFSSERLVVATGGLSYRKLGASGLGFELAKKFGHRIVPPQPALVGLVFGPSEQKTFSCLAGVSADAKVSTCGHEFIGGLLFTHKGLSGPAILNASLYWKKGERIVIDFAQPVPKRIVQLYRGASSLPPPVLRAAAPARRRGSGGEGRLRIVIVPASRDSFERAEATLGGVDTTDISSKTMESRIVKGLYFTGEALDVTGELGGYNLHWAWASGAACGEAL